MCTHVCSRSFGGKSMSGYRYCTAVFVFLAAFAIAPPWKSPRAAGPSPGGAPPAMTLDEALRLAEQASPLVRRARAERDVVVAREVGASLLMPANPLVVGAVGPRHERTGPIDERGLQ